MDALDGNAIGGLLIDVFGTEMTAARSTCATCGDIRPAAELVVYRQAPGTVVRCRTCSSVLMVFVRAYDVIGTDLAGLASLSQPDRPLSRPSGLRASLRAGRARRHGKERCHVTRRPDVDGPAGRRPHDYGTAGPESHVIPRKPAGPARRARGEVAASLPATTS